MTAITSPHTIVFADPYKTCRECGGWIRGVSRSPGQPDSTIPCGHDRGYDGVCPSWSPVDGCLCEDHLGYVPHDEPPAPPSP